MWQDRAQTAWCLHAHYIYSSIHQCTCWISNLDMIVIVAQTDSHRESVGKVERGFVKYSEVELRSMEQSGHAHRQGVDTYPSCSLNSLCCHSLCSVFRHTWYVHEFLWHGTNHSVVHGRLYSLSHGIGEVLVEEYRCIGAQPLERTI